MKPDEIPDEVVTAAQQADHEEGVRDGRSYHRVAEHQVRRLIAGAVAAERERLAGVLDHRAQELADDDDAGSVRRMFACVFGDAAALIREQS
jgi:hypothetical protein